MEELNRICAVTGLPFSVTLLEQELRRKFEVSLPTLHPLERLRRLAAMSNYVHLFQRTCSKTGDKVISVFRPTAQYPVYRNDLWWSDSWDALAYGREYDFKRPFFPQFKELLDAVPKPALAVSYATLENCDYINGASFCRNCYLIFDAAYNDDSYYCFFLQHSKDCIDCSSVLHSELCYDCTYVERSYDVRHAFNCRDCRESSFLWNCVGCQHCFGCVNLGQASYCWYNEQLSSAEFARKLGAYHGDSYAEVEHERARFMEFVKSQPHPAMRGVNTIDCSGDFLNYCFNAQHCFEAVELRDCVNCMRISSSQDCLDQYGFGIKCELIYDCCRVGYQSTNVRHGVMCWLNCADVEYTYFAMSCRNCFACVGLHNQEYCIFNRRYPKTQYQELRARIIAQMKDPRVQGGQAAYGEFFPYSLSPHVYTDSDAHLFFPLTKDECEKRNAEYYHEEESAAAHGISVACIPDRSSETLETICQSTFLCKETNKPFRITAQELKRYKNRGLPLPRLHWLTRLLKRKKVRNPLMSKPGM